MREVTAAVMVNVSFSSDVCDLSVNLVSPGTVTAVATVAAAAVVIVVVVDGVRNISVVIISVVSLCKLLVDNSDIMVEVAPVTVLATMVTGCTEGGLVGIDDNTGDKSPMER